MSKRSLLCCLVLLLTLIGFAIQAFAQGTPFTHKDVSFTLPEGWVSQDIPANFEKETVA